MATTYYYTVNLQQYLNSVWINITVPEIKINFNDFRKNPAGTSYTNQAGNVEGSENELQWVVKAYKVVNGGSPVQLNKNEVKVELTGGGNQGVFDQIVKTVSTSTQDYFRVTINKTLLNSLAVKFPFYVYPGFTVTTKPDVIAVPRKTGDPTEVVVFTQAATFPQVPTGLIAAVNLPGNTTTANIHYDKSIDRFVGIKATTNSNGTITYTAYYYFKGADGTQDKVVTIGTDAKGLGTKGSAYKTGQALLINAIDSAKVTNEKVENPTASGTGQYTTNSRLEPVGGDRWNPPPHPKTKGMHREWQFSKSTVTNNVVQAKDIIYNKVPQGVMGRIFQDADSAASVNLTDPKKLWGFRFMYNPTTVQYQTQANTNVDFTFGAADPAQLLAGNISFQFQLYLNRILDMTHLQGDRKTGQDYIPSLGTEAIDGLINRGTEYDLEFLYRVCNGDPDTSQGLNPLLTYAGGMTSDIGLLKALPVWIVINENMRIFGSISNISVNHVMFDRRMVPILSTVDLTVTRYPALMKYSSNSKTDDANKYDISALKKVIGTDTTANPAASGNN